MSTSIHYREFTTYLPVAIKNCSVRSQTNADNTHAPTPLSEIGKISLLLSGCVAV